MSIFGRLGVVFAEKWVAGITVDDAINAARKLNLEREYVTINYLGEEFKERKKVEQSLNLCLEIIEKMKRNRIKGNVAVKPTQLGLSISKQLFQKNYEKVIRSAKSAGVFVWTDMEEYKFIDRIIEVYLNTIKKYNNIGICLQCKLKRTYNDVIKVSKHHGTIRLVKGAYRWPATLAFKEANEIRDNYTNCMRYLFRKKGNFMVATHDKLITDEAVQLEKKYKRQIMFGMLKGIRGGLAKELAYSGEKVYIYLPFGENWMSYSLRRMKELSNAKLVLRSMFGG